MVVSAMKKTLYYSIFLFLSFKVILSDSSSFCTYPNKFDNNFPDLGESEKFYLKKITGDYYIIGTEKEATAFSLPSFEESRYKITTLKKMSYPYFVYSDSYGNIDPIVLGVNTVENPLKIYILTEGIKTEDEYNIALYDASQGELREGKLSYVFNDFKILEPLNEKEYLGAVQLYDSSREIYSIKLQVMSFTQISNGYIKQLAGKEYAETTNSQQNVNDIFYITPLKKILIIRTIMDEIYFDFIDYDSYFGTLQEPKKIKAPFNVKEYRFKSIVLSREDKKTYIATCFRKLNYLYCYSGYYDEEKDIFSLLQDNPKLMLSTCSDKIYKNMALYTLSFGIGIVGCSGNPYYVIRFNKYLENIGTPIKFEKDYSEFLVVNNYTLFIMYSEKSDDTNKYELFACLYYLPVCHTPQKIFLKNGNYFDFKELIKYDDDLHFMKYIIIESRLINSGKFYIKNVDYETTENNYNEFNNLYYRYDGDKSFEDIIYYHTFVNVDNQGERSQECILSIINCYKSCETCDDIGDENNNNCLECNEEEEEGDDEKENIYFFIEDKTSKQCTTKALIEDEEKNYYFDKDKKVFKRCYEGCKTCTGQKTSVSHNCKKCDERNNYYPLRYFCYLFNQPPDGYYFDKLRQDEDDQYFKECDISNCAICIQTITDSDPKSIITCKKCKVYEGFYALFSDEAKTNAECINYKPDGYFLDIKAGEYKKCYPTCETCSKSGSDEFNNCDTCKSGFYNYVIDSSTCKCKYNFYYQKDDSNHKIFTCTENEKCPNEENNKYPYLIINSQNIRQCVSNCPSDYPYIYNYQCYNHIPNGTTLIEDSSINCEDDDITYDQCIVNDYIKSTVPLSDISKVEQDYINNYRTQYTNIGNNDYTYNHVNIVRNNNDEYLLLIFENEKCIEKFISEYGLGYTDLSVFSSKIKSENGIGENEPLIYSYLYSYNEPLNGTTPIENLTYNCYNKDTGEKLNLDILDGENITQHVPAPSGADLQKLNYLSKYSDLGVDFSDPNSDFFNSQCYLFTSDNGKDVTLADRRKYFFNNVKICEDDCVFSGIDESTNTAMCSCPYKSSSSGGGETQIKAVTFPDYDEDYFIFDMWKCLSKKMVEGKELKKSYITIIVFCILLLTILFTILYFCCNKNRFQFLSKVSSQYSSISKSSRTYSQKNISIQNQKINNPPKKEGEGDTDSNLMKEKGYVHDVKRPFNYDNNNLFFHADEHYTIGNNNLNSLFMGQNFKNDYSEKMEQFNNDKKKPKQVINNYNNINIPGKRINKNSSKKTPKINNYNNINIGPDIINIKESNPEPPSINKEKKTRNNPIILKDSSDIDSVDPIRNEKTPIKPSINSFNKHKKLKPDDSSEKSYTNFSNKRSLLSNRNNSLTGKIPEDDKEKDKEFNEDIKKAINEIGEDNMKINKADYDSARETDFRSFCSFYFNQLKHRQIFLYTGYFHKYAENIFMKIMIIIFHILLCLFLNLFWYRTYYVHSEFISPITNHSTFSSKYAWFRILLSVLFYIIIIGLLHLIYLPQLNIYYSLSNDKLDKKKKMEIMEKNIKWMKINYIIFIVINFCFLIVLLLYVLVFSYVFQNSKTDLMVSFILTVVITQALPFVFVLFVTIFRFIGLKCNSPCSYNFSLFFTI